MWSALGRQIRQGKFQCTSVGGRARIWDCRLQVLQMFATLLQQKARDPKVYGVRELFRLSHAWNNDTCVWSSRLWYVIFTHDPYKQQLNSILFVQAQFQVSNYNNNSKNYLYGFLTLRLCREKVLIYLGWCILQGKAVFTRHWLEDFSLMTPQPLMELSVTMGKTFLISKCDVLQLSLLKVIGICLLWLCGKLVHLPTPVQAITIKLNTTLQMTRIW